MSYSSAIDHYSMAFDQIRNNVYFEALKNTVTKKSVVLDLGAGLGIHGLMAASLGAEHVYLVERTAVIEVASRIAKQNGLAEKMTFIQGRIEEIGLPRQADIIVSVFTGNFLLSEDLLSSLFFARDKYLSPKGHLLPDRAEMFIAPISDPVLYGKKIEGWSTPNSGFDFSETRPYAANNIYYMDRNEISPTYLATPKKLTMLDFMAANKAGCDATVNINISKDGICHGLLGWFNMRLGDTWLSTSPAAAPTHWSPAFLPVDPVVEVKEGTVLDVKISRPENGEWTWKLGYENDVQTHSTFLSTPLSPRDFAIRSQSYKPEVNRKIEAANFLFSNIDGFKSVSDLNRGLLHAFGDIFDSEEEVKRFSSKLLALLG